MTPSFTGSLEVGAKRRLLAEGKQVSQRARGLRKVEHDDIATADDRPLGAQCVLDEAAHVGAGTDCGAGLEELALDLVHLDRLLRKDGSRALFAVGCDVPLAMEDIALGLQLRLVEERELVVAPAQDEPSMIASSTAFESRTGTEIPRESRIALCFRSRTSRTIPSMRLSLPK